MVTPSQELLALCADPEWAARTIAEQKQELTDLHAFADDRELAVKRLQAERESLQFKLDEERQYSERMLAAYQEAHRQAMENGAAYHALASRLEQFRRYARHHEYCEHKRFGEKCDCGYAELDAGAVERRVQPGDLECVYCGTINNSAHKPNCPERTP